MDSITTLIRNEIKNQYGSIKKFSDASGIPYSTLSNALAKGIGGTAYNTVAKICNLLGIKQTGDRSVVLLSQKFFDIYYKLSQLDGHDLHMVETIINAEYERCTSADSKPVVKAFNGIGLASRDVGDYLNENNGYGSCI